jgi:hypothetical protein
MSADMDTEMLFENFDNIHAPMQYCNFKAQNPRAVMDYLQGVSAYLRDHNFTEHLKQLAETEDANHLLAEMLDKDLTHACILAAKRC